MDKEGDAMWSFRLLLVLPAAGLREVRLGQSSASEPENCLKTSFLPVFCQLCFGTCPQ